MKIIDTNRKSSLPNSSGAKLCAKVQRNESQKYIKYFAMAYSPEPFANEKISLS